MKLTVLTENTSSKDCLGCEHGLSLYIETNGHKILFDAGETEIFSLNARELSIDLSDVDFAVLSHDHCDHSGGMGRFLDLNKKAPLYVNKYAKEGHYNSLGEYIGIDTSLFDRGRIIFTDDEYQISKNITLFTCNGNEYVHPIDPAGLKMVVSGELADEDFRHEQYMLIEENSKRILISGCSHKGILNIMNWLKPDILVGGFHFMNMSTEEAESRKFLENAAKELLSYNCIYYTGHCTGMAQFEYMKSIMGERLQYISSGMKIKL